MSDHVFKPLKGLTKATKVLIGLAMPGMLAYVVCLVMQMVTGERVDFDAEELSVLGTVAALVSLYLIIAWIAAGITSLFWIYGAARNAAALQPNVELSPGWAVGWYFVPIALLFKPYQYMEKIWNISLDVAEDAETTRLLGYWWAAHVVGGIVTRIAERTTKFAAESGVMFDLAMEAVGYSLILISMALFFRIVETVHKNQMKLRSGDAAASVF
ncbi:MULTISPECIES: DUF4328 domain-containing protein [Asticcacaulis]|uniref:DUF4328 domain-containing protein n=1 Tax=Asticcacaulis TaxID=76890 RepID=UPI001AE213EA|nr:MULTISPECIES: DUF4328 domain-containing protein [Asticcacaulis]MBP2160676.1 heme/copper-type cytochrome/quinol oxidase subunit 2 [Asticcacaulis solisilvae]MDR6801721.1 heme/copper-type cytochrome/quinol oxidase subunit 2 [Asticcacaulis sp. BE141]